jgi:hypothetical protein
VVTWLKGLTGSLSGAVFIYCVACALAAIAALLLTRNRAIN